MVKRDVVQKVSGKTGYTQKEVKEIIDGAFLEIKDAVSKGEKVSFVGFGTFERRLRAKKKGTNPSNGKPMTIEATNVPYFKPGQEFKNVTK
jgi:DNA-binding protein HU-beta